MLGLGEQGVGESDEGKKCEKETAHGKTPGSPICRDVACHVFTGSIGAAGKVLQASLYGKRKSVAGLVAPPSALAGARGPVHLPDNPLIDMASKISGGIAALCPRPR